MFTTIECKGHPRDMGLAQGTSARSAIRAEAERLGLPLRRTKMPILRPLVSGSFRGKGAGREMFRHFAHQAERLEGIARAADLPMDTILDLHLRIREGGEKGGLLARRSSLLARTVANEYSKEGRGVILSRTLPAPSDSEPNWILRESSPEVGFRSVEVTLPWLATSVAGVNEGGLAALSGPLLWSAPQKTGASHSLLLVQDCLQRFIDLEGALGWCRKRPVEGEHSIVLADASGKVATVAFSREGRQVQMGEGEIHLEAGELPGEEVSGPPGDDASEVEMDCDARRLRIRVNGSIFDLRV